MSIAALVSGGVDSSVVVHLLCEQGIKPDIFYIRIGMEDEEGYIDCPATTSITEARISTIPTASHTVNRSPKTKMPISTAVSGSRAPSTAVVVEPA